MNCDLLRWAIRQHLPVSQHSVLVILAERDGEPVARRAIAEQLDLSERQVTNIIKALVTRKMVEIERVGGDGTGRQANRYRVIATGSALPVDQREAASNGQPTSGNGLPKAPSGNGKPDAPSPQAKGNALPKATGSGLPVGGNGKSPPTPPSKNITPRVELYPETVEDDISVSRASARERTPAEIVVAAVNSPYLDPNKSQRLVSGGARVAQWMTKGADLEADIIPTVRGICQRMNGHGSPIHTWTYFDEPIRAAIEERKAANNFELQETTNEHGTRKNRRRGRGDGGSDLTDWMLRECAPR